MFKGVKQKFALLLLFIDIVFLYFLLPTNNSIPNLKLIRIFYI